MSTEIPVHRELLARGVTLAALARAVAHDGRAFVLTGRWLGADSIAGSAPQRDLRDDEDPFAALDELPAVARDGEVCFGGGWVGLLGSALAHHVEDLPPSPPRRGATAPPHRLAYYDNVVRLTPGGDAWFEALVAPDRAGAQRVRAATLRRRLEASPRPAEPWSVSPLRPLPPGLAGHAEAIRSVIERIRAGEIYQANLCLRLAGCLQGSALEAWLALMRNAPAAYGAYLAWDGGALLSASPELLVRRAGRTVASEPMKGTRPRVEGDERAARELAASAKDAAENVMIVDLVRNDLGRVCDYGSVAAVRPHVEPHPGVWQLVARVEGRLREGVADAAVLRALFPPGSVVGTPKIQALKAIAAEEATARGAHCGAIGFASPLAGLVASVAIRTFELAGDELALGVGGGIVADSDPGAEVQECLDKAAPLVAALSTHVMSTHVIGAEAPTRERELPALLTGGRERPDPARGVFETVQLEDGRPVALDAHLARLAGSVRELWAGELDREAIRCEVDHLAMRGASALRILATPRTTTVAPRPGTERDPRLAVALEPMLLPGGLGPHKWIDRDLLASEGPTPLLCDRGGDVLEAAWANVWTLRKGLLTTPPADGRILPGTARARLLADPRRVKGATRTAERPLSIHDLERADEILLTSSLGTVRAVLAGQPLTAASTIRSSSSAL